ncbi:MAG: hypothetical protein JO362_10375 [Streptomycetaceae bacterium]|nr:hypothetical protein [Streptomycetaceae bacterium]
MTHPIALPLAIAPIALSPLLTALVALPVVAVLLAGWLIRRSRARASSGRSGAPAVWVAALAAVGCTVYSADTSWRFAADYLDMAGTAERAAMFGAAELALFATALMARQNLGSLGAPGLPGILVWVITGVQVIPAYAESGPVGGTVRAFVGPIMAALLWHQAMGIELRLRAPQAASQGILSVLGREVRERLLSRLGVAERDRDAAQITRDRATAQAVALAARLAERSPQRRENWRGQRITRRLSKALARAGVGTDLKQRRELLDQLAARQHATALATVDLPSPWTQPLRDQDEDDDYADRRLFRLPAADRMAIGDQPRRRLRTVPDAGPQADTSPITDRREGDRAGPSTGTGPTESGDRPHTVPNIKDRTSAGDRADEEDSRLAVGADESGDEADGGARHARETAAQGATGPSPSPTPVPDYGDRGRPEAEAGTMPGDRSHTVPDDGDRDQTGTVTGTDESGDQRPVPETTSPSEGDGDRSRGGRGGRSRPKLSEDEIVARIRPHVPAVLERDKNSDITRVQLREIMRAQRISIRNDRLSPVLQRLRSETGNPTTNRSRAR